MRSELDALRGVSGGIATLKPPSARWLSWTAYNLIARNARPAPAVTAA